MHYQPTARIAERWLHIPPHCVAAFRFSDCEQPSRRLKGDDRRLRYG